MNDPRGNPAGTASAQAIDAAERALWRMMSFYGVPLDDVDAAAAADPGWALPPLMRAGFLLSLTEPPLVAQAAAALDQADTLLARAPHAREAAHLAALRRLAAGDWRAACDGWDALLLQHPRDALALQWAHLFDFHRGDAESLRLRVARVLPEWDAADPLQPYVLGMHAFGLEECHFHAQAEAAGAARSPAARVPWAIHAVAHVMEMQGRHAEGGAWMRQWRPDWTDGNGFAGHLGWHEALFALEALDIAGALALFDEHLRADPAQITLQRLDAAALLWRLDLLGDAAGADLTTRWRALLDGWPAAPGDAGLSAFNDLHRLLALLGAREFDEARRWVDAAGRACARAAAPDRARAARTGLALMRGLLAHAHGHAAEAVSLLWPAREQAQRIGGSHAQRDVIAQTLLAAAADAGDTARVRALLNERRLAKPATPLARHWAARCEAGPSGSGLSQPSRSG